MCKLGELIGLALTQGSLFLTATDWDSVYLMCFTYSPPFHSLTYSKHFIHIYLLDSRYEKLLHSTRRSRPAKVAQNLKRLISQLWDSCFKGFMIYFNHKKLWSIFFIGFVGFLGSVPPKNNCVLDQLFGSKTLNWNSQTIPTTKIWQQFIFSSVLLSLNKKQIQ